MPSSRVDPVPLAVLGGSSAFLPSLATALADVAAGIPPLEVRLFGNDFARTEAVARFCSLHAASRGVAHCYIACADVESTIRGTPVVVNQARIGGFPGRSRDEQLALRYGYPGDETIGPGGLAAAVRATGPILEMAREVERLMPDAWFVQVANPMSMLLASILAATSLRTFGLCELPDDTLARAVASTGRTGPVASEYVGVNHQGWFVRVTDGGTELLPEIFDRIAELVDGGFFRVDADVMRAFGGLPLPYLRLLLHREREFGKQRARAADRGRQLAGLAEALYAHYAITDDPKLPSRLRDRPMPWNAMTIAPVLAALLGGPPATAYVSDRNDGHLAFLPASAVVEKRATIRASGLDAVPISVPVEARRPTIVALLRRIAEFERLGSRAARGGDPDAARAALAVHPYAITGPPADAMIEAMFCDAPRRSR